jgi:hypothetical protein
MIRFNVNRDISIEVVYINGKEDEAIYKAYLEKSPQIVDFVSGDLRVPACLISGYSKGKMLWGFLFSAGILDAPYCVITMMPDFDLLFCGYGKNLYCLQFSNGKQLWHRGTEYPIQNILQDEEDAVIYFVTEIAIEKLSITGDIFWEYWHKEPIENVIIAKEWLELQDIESEEYAILKKSGKAII